MDQGHSSVRPFLRRRKRAGNAAGWEGTFLAGKRPYVQTPVPEEGKGGREEKVEKLRSKGLGERHQAHRP